MQISLLDLGPSIDALHSDTHAAWEALPESSDVDASLYSLRRILERLRDCRPNPDGWVDPEIFNEIVRDLDNAIEDHASDQDRAQQAIDAAADHGSEAMAWADDIRDRYADMEFEALWAEVDRARSMVTPPFVPSLDCPACIRAAAGAPSTASHDRQCPRRPAPPVTIDPATGLPPRPVSKAAVFDRLDALTARQDAPVIRMDDRRPAPVSCTLCRTGSGKRHGRGCSRGRGKLG